MPLSYPSGTIAEHTACRTDAVVFDVSHLGTVRSADSGAFERLQRTLTNDLTRIGPGRAQYTHLLDENGFVLDDVIVWWVDDNRFDVMPNASNTAAVVAAVGGVDVTEERAVLAVQGPNARSVVAKVSDHAAAVPRMGVTHIDYRNCLCTLAGTGYTGEDGLEITVPVEAAVELFEDLLEAGAQPAGLGARDTLRLEAGFPLHGHELGAGITPLQAGLGWVVGWDKGDFVGRDALVEEREQGVSRKLTGFVTEGRQPPREGSAVFIDGDHVGVVTSGNYSPVLNKGIAMGFLPPDAAPGTKVEMEVRGRRLNAEVVRPPFVALRK